MQKLIYHDLLDTVRTSSLIEDKKKVAKARFIGSANLMLSVLIGETPVISQTHAFDSSIILTTIESPEDTSAFRSLLRRGFIRVKLFNQANLKTAFKAALENPKFVFSGWPELEKGEVERKAIEMFLNGDKITSFPESVRYRLEAINCLNAVIGESKYTKNAKVPEVLLEDYIKYSALKIENTELKNVIKKLDTLESKESKNRSFYYKTLDEMEICDNIRETARELVDMFYNKVISDSLGVDYVSLTTNKSGALQNVKNVLVTGIQVREPFVSKEVKGINEVGWNQIDEFLGKNERLDFDSHYFDKLSEFLAKAHSEKKGVAIIPKICSKLFSGLTVGGVAVILNSLFGQQIAPTIGSTFVVGTFGGILGSIFDLPISSKIKNIQIRKFQTYYKGILQGVTSE